MRSERSRRSADMMGSGPEAPFTYASDELDSLAAATNYYRAIAARFAPHLGEGVIEVGAGVGTFSEYLRAQNGVRSLTLIEPAVNNFPVLERRFERDERVQVMPGYLDRYADRLRADSLVAVNVLEHVLDDGAFLATAHRALRPGGALLLFVPAVPAIFGTLDEAFEHHRRYTKRGLRELVQRAGFDVNELAFTNLPGVLTWCLAGRVLRRRTISVRDARLFDRWIMPLVMRMERLIEPPIGQSLVLVARR